MRKRRVLARLLLVALLAMSVASSLLSTRASAESTAQHSSYVDDLTNLASVKDGAKPSFDPHEYDSYRVPGKATIAIPIYRFFKDGTTVPVEPLMFLYPLTAYTTWMFTHYVILMNGKVATRAQSYPGDDNTNEPVPAYLNPSGWFEAGSAIKKASSCKNGICYFTEVPRGKYIVFASDERFIFVDKVIEYRAQTITADDGTPATLFTDVHGKGIENIDGFSFIGGPIRIDSDNPVTYPRDMMKAAAYYTFPKAKI